MQIADGATLDLGGTVQTLSGIDGSGTVSNGTLAVTGDLWPGGDGTLGTLKLVDGSVSGSATLHVDVTAGGLCDRLEVDGLRIGEEKVDLLFERTGRRVDVQGRSRTGVQVRVR